MNNYIFVFLLMAFMGLAFLGCENLEEEYQLALAYDAYCIEADDACMGYSDWLDSIRK